MLDDLKKRKMNVILLTSDYHLSANVAMGRFLKNPLLKKHKIKVSGIIMTSPYGLGRKSIRKMKGFIQKSGWGFSIKSMLLEIWGQFKIKIGKYLVPNKYRYYFDIDELAKAHQIPFLKTDYINSKKVKHFIKEKTPDYLVSCHLLQIIDEDILDLPKKGAINAHPSLTQKHRGTFTAFWSLFNRWKNSGTTVHFMTKEIDKGKIIIQKKFRIRKKDTIHCINHKSARLSAKLLIKALIKLKRKERCGYAMKKMGKWFAMPNEKVVNLFYKKGKGLVKTADIFVL